MASIRTLNDEILRGQIRIPAFQRGFVWEMPRAAMLMDSIYKGYPFGSLLFWRTRFPLASERNLGPYEVPDIEPDYPLNYVLDGQQRVTSLFATFQNGLPRPTDPTDWVDIYFDLDAEPDAQDSQFVPLTEDEVADGRHFPLRVLFDPIEFFQAASQLDDAKRARVVELQRTFQEADIPIQMLETEDRAKVAIVFERVNRLGVPLDTLQLLTAWTWNEDFDLQARFRDLSEELSDFGFREVGEDTDLVLRCCAAVIAGDPSADALINLNGEDVRNRFPEVVNGIEGAIDFLKRQFGISSLSNLPYPQMLVPLAVFFAIPAGQLQVTDAQRQVLTRWFWRSCFARRYSGQTTRASQSDIAEMRNLRDGEPCDLGAFSYEIEPSFFTANQFRITAANTKTFVLMLAQAKPLSFLSGAEIDLEKVLQSYNRAEFHHMYPDAYLMELDVERGRINGLANFCFLSRADNNRIGKKAPSVYRDLMPTTEGRISEIIASALAPAELFEDDFENFIEKRLVMLTDRARLLMA